ncbi:hypothetical protein [Bacillus sp. AFS017336]|uniref:hypothetical protein n=1 Tax=Bacillus sp. AFS017336 TaxID=2033489 RepID=UPI000BF153C7|nr:hypothetical protein [Bacillus sp. AFS017336]PEL06758.1 hypothetical protein CN601_20745 [Bacillus sp. AFS017336]
MNKIKLMYDITKTMKKKEQVKVNLDAEILKNGQKTAFFGGEFDKDLTKHSFHPFQHRGRRPFGPGFRNRGFFEQGGNGEYQNSEFCQENIKQDELKEHKFPSKFKMGFSRASMFFGLLSSIEVQETENGATLMLDSKDIPEDLKESFKEMRENRKKFMLGMQRANCSNKNQMSFLQEVEDPNFLVKANVNTNKEIESLTVYAKGLKNHEDTPQEVLELKYQSTFTWK